MTTPLEIFDALATVATSPRRRRMPMEAPLAYTEAYVDFMFAYGSARLAQDELARQRVRASYTKLAGVAADIVHAYLIAAFTTRIDQALMDLPPRPTDALDDQLAELGRVARYKVDRLREASRILEPLEQPSAVDRWNEGRTGRSAFDDLPLEDRVTAIREIVGRTDGDHHALNDALQALAVVEPSTAVPLLRSAWHAIGHVVADERALLYVKTMAVAEQLGQRQLVSEVLDHIRAVIPQTTHSLGQSLGVAIPIASRNGLRREMVEILIATEAATISSGIVPVRIMIAGGMAALGEYETARPILDDAHTALTTRTMSVAARLDLIRAFALAAAELPFEEGIKRIAELVPQGLSISDNYGTNSHFCISVLHFVDSLVVAVVSCARPRS